MKNFEDAAKKAGTVPITATMDIDVVPDVVPDINASKNDVSVRKEL